MISAGRENPFGHPHQQALDVLGDIRIHVTSRSGAVRIVETESGLKADTFQEFRLKETDAAGEELLNFKKLFAVW